MQPGRSPLPPLPTRPPAGEGTHLAGSGCTGFSPPPGANPAGCFMGRTSTLPRGEQREGRVCRAGRGHPAQGHLLPLLRAAQQALTRADRLTRPPCCPPSRQAQAPRGWALQPFSQKGRPAAEPCGPRSPRAGNLRLLSRGCATAGPPVQVRSTLRTTWGGGWRQEAPLLRGAGAPHLRRVRGSPRARETLRDARPGTRAPQAQTAALPLPGAGGHGACETRPTQPRGKEQERSCSDRVLGPRSRWRAAAPCPPPPGGRWHPEV